MKISASVLHSATADSLFLSRQNNVNCQTMYIVVVVFEFVSRLRKDWCLVNASRRKLTFLWGLEGF